MNRFSANVSLYIITFFAAVQYVFLTNVPDNTSTFAFLCITNLIGFLITLCVFFGELRRLDKKQLFQSLVLSLSLLGFNVFLLLGSRNTSSTVVASVLSSYFAFVVLLTYLITHRKPTRNCMIGIAILLIGVFLMMNADFSALFSGNIPLLLIADVFFALYLIQAEKYAVSSNPSILALGQIFFNFLINGICWAGESVITGKPFSLPEDHAFWASVFFISFFIRGLYGIVQIYAQRYVSPLNISLIFSTEIIMTMLASPLLSALFGTEPETITPIRIAGAVVMIAGILLADSGVYAAIERRLHREKA